MPSLIYPQIVCMICPPEIAKSDLPSNCLYNLPPQNRQVPFALKSSVRFTPLKLPSLIYPQIVCTIYPYEITKSNLPSNCLYNLPPTPQNRQVQFTLKSPVQFTPPKSPSPIYPQIICMIYPQIVCMIYPPKSPSLIYPQIVCTIYPQIVCMITNFASLVITNGV